MWNTLPSLVREKIVRAGFKTYTRSVPFAERDGKLAFAMAQRWWDTNIFHIPCGEVTLTPQDFSSITRIRVSGKKIYLDLTISGPHKYT